MSAHRPQPRPVLRIDSLAFRGQTLDDAAAVITIQRMRLLAIRTLGALTALFVAGCTQQTNTPPADLDTDRAIADAKRAAQAWLEIVDGGDYAASWAASASLFRRAVGKERWVQQLNGVRAPLGNMEARTVRSARYATQLPGAPDGEYVVIQYDTRFSNKRSTIETVTPMKDPDGQWRVSGYYIR